jgi:hypothetical protein
MCQPHVQQVKQQGENPYVLTEVRSHVMVYTIFLMVCDASDLMALFRYLVFNK